MTDDSLPFLRESPKGLLLRVTVQPRAGKNGIAGIHGERLKIRLTAPPVDGEANKACAAFLSEIFGIPKSAVEIVEGFKSRSKTIRLAGLTPERAGEALKKFL